MPSLEIVLGLLLAVTALALLARYAHVPYPILLVIGGLVIGFIPGLPTVQLAPDVVFLIFLPPLITAAGWYTSVRDLKFNRRPIALLSVGLVLFTTVSVAAVAHALIPDLGWAPALLLGAIVSPTDAIAATAIMQRLGAPHRIVAILEGESLLNDATGLVAYRFAVMAVLTGAFSIWIAGAQFLLSVVAGAAIGLLVGWALIQAWRRIDDPVLGIVLSFLAPFAAYLPADRILHVSGVLAVAVAGIYAGRRSSEVIPAVARVQAAAVWDLVIFVLNGLAFILIGLQLRQVLAGLRGESAWELALYGVAISLAVIVGRFVWVFPATYLPRFLNHRLRRRDPNPGWRNVVVIAWTGMRGVVSLAAALAIPLTVSSGAPFPHRDLILFLTFCVILVTLVVQGLSLPLVLRGLGVAADGSEVREEARARFQAVDAAMSRLEELAGQDEQTEAGVGYMQRYYQKRRHVLSTRFGKLDHDHDGDPDGSQLGHVHADGADHLEEHRARAENMRQLKQELIGVERTTVLRLRNQGEINDAALRRVERDLDLEEIRLINA
ncbi:MAG: Na+/H+ antiporter [Candidatus Dormibacteraeota bacterium]|nr:Na+/H+ antiporter [Candidatus Dormibacteraeota bacterium]